MMPTLPGQVLGTFVATGEEVQHDDHRFDHINMYNNKSNSKISSIGEEEIMIPSPFATHKEQWR